jgi:hypothetical protein
MDTRQTDMLNTMYERRIIDTKRCATELYEQLLLVHGTNDVEAKDKLQSTLDDLHNLYLRMYESKHASGHENKCMNDQKFGSVTDVRDGATSVVTGGVDSKPAVNQKNKVRKINGRYEIDADDTDLNESECVEILHVNHKKTGKYRCFIDVSLALLLVFVSTFVTILIVVMAKDMACEQSIEGKIAAYTHQQSALDVRQVNQIACKNIGDYFVRCVYGLAQSNVALNEVVNLALRNMTMWTF